MIFLNDFQADLAIQLAVLFNFKTLRKVSSGVVSLPDFM